MYATSRRGRGRGRDEDGAQERNCVFDCRGSLLADLQKFEANDFFVSKISVSTRMVTTTTTRAAHGSLVQLSGDCTSRRRGTEPLSESGAGGGAGGGGGPVDDDAF